MRALVIFCALLSLCVSDTVGPRLLPLPEAAASSAADRQDVEGAGVTPAPPREGDYAVRESMAPPARKQAGAERHTLHFTAGVAEGLVKPPAEIPSSVQTVYPPAPQSSAAATRPPGRAPPLSA